MFRQAELALACRLSYPYSSMPKMLFNSANAAAMAAKSAEARRNKAKANILAAQNDSQPALNSVNPLADGLSHAQGEILSRLRAADDPKEIAACARALREVRETWHMVTGEPRPGIRRDTGRKSSQPAAAQFHLPPANCGPGPTTNGMPSTESGLTAPQAGQVADGQQDAGSGI